MNIFMMSRPSPGPAWPAHTRPRPGPSPMCLNCFQPRPGPGPQYVGPGLARPAKLCRGPARGLRAGLGPKARPTQGTSGYVNISEKANKGGEGRGGALEGHGIGRNGKTK